VSGHGLRGIKRKGGPATRGYVLVCTARYRNWLLHRAIVDIHIKEWNPLGWEGIPADRVVHHVDFNRSHNCDCNLLLLDGPLHDACRPKMQVDPRTGRFLPREEPLTETDLNYLDELVENAGDWSVKHGKR
jgi:hypothetical protein